MLLPHIRHVALDHQSPQEHTNTVQTGGRGGVTENKIKNKLDQELGESAAYAAAAFSKTSDGHTLGTT